MARPVYSADAHRARSLAFVTNPPPVHSLAGLKKRLSESNACGDYPNISSMFKDFI